jgi:histidinol-phosphate aminotransferase
MKKHKNLIIFRTFSKLYSAAIRLGYMIADKEIIDAVNKVRLPYNINSFSQMIALEILKLGSYSKNKAAVTIRERDKMSGILENYYEIVKSDANFLFVRTKGGAEKSKKYFQKNGFSIRIFESGPAKGWMRLTIGKPKENIAVLKMLLRGAK